MMIINSVHYIMISHIALTHCPGISNTYFLRMIHLEIFFIDAIKNIENALILAFVDLTNGSALVEKYIDDVQ